MTKLKKKIYILKSKKRHLKKIVGNITKPRLTIYKSNKHIYSQLIDDLKGHTLCSSSTVEKKNPDNLGFNKINMSSSYFIGQKLALRAKSKNIVNVVFDRDYQLYHGRIKKLIEGLRDEGIVC